MDQGPTSARGNIQQNRLLVNIMPSTMGLLAPGETHKMAHKPRPHRTHDWEEKDDNLQRRPAPGSLAQAHSPPPLRLSDFPLPLSLALSLPLLFDFVKGQDVSLLFAFRFAILTLGALFTKIGFINVREMITTNAQ